MDECEAVGCRMRSVRAGLCPAHEENKRRYGHPTKITRQPPTLAEHLVPIWEELSEQVRPSIGMAGLEALAIQVYRLRTAQEKITSEGMVVADPKGNPTPHPALRVEKDAQSEIRRWIKDYGVQ